jgi:radical SAM superfamily enzyme
MIEINVDSLNEWCRDIICYKSIDWIQTKECRDEIERRIKRIHEFQILTNTYEHIENILNRYNNYVEEDNSKTP